jgi:Tol biopolymer transport system component
MAWMDSQGNFSPLRQMPGRYYEPTFSPDGKRLAFTIQDGERNDIWVYDLARNRATRLTFTGEANSRPVWTPDGKRIAYASQDQATSTSIWWTRADGGGDPQRLTAPNNQFQYPISWSPDGKLLSISSRSGNARLSMLTLSIEGNDEVGWKPGVPKPFRNEAVPYTEGFPVFSPDGRWLAYRSNESGNYEVYVTRSSGSGGKWPISAGGGILPRWSRDGKQLYYRTVTDSQLMVVDCTATADSFQCGKPRLWSPGRFTDRDSDRNNFDVHPDGKRAVVLKAPEDEQTASITKVSVIFNWFDEVAHRVSSGAK